jgi:integrase
VLVARPERLPPRPSAAADHATGHARLVSDEPETREQVRALIGGARPPHVRLAALLLYTTAARSAALLGLLWDRCDFDTDRIDLRDPAMTMPHKKRAVVPMLRTAKVALPDAHRGALTAFVIEYAGRGRLVGQARAGDRRSPVCQ